MAKSKTPWSDKKEIAALSREPIGKELAEKVSSKLVSDGGKRGIWYHHRDYCGHGLIFLNGMICLVEYSDGFIREGTTLKSWETESSFIDWLKNQNDYSLSGADLSEPEIFTSNPFTRNNQRITTHRLNRYLTGERNP